MPFLGAEPHETLAEVLLRVRTRVFRRPDQSSAGEQTGVLQMSVIPDPLQTILRRYCQVESYDPAVLRHDLRNGKGFPYDEALVKQQLRQAIDRRSITPEDYAALTSEDFDSQEELQTWLENLWHVINA